MKSVVLQGDFKLQILYIKGTPNREDKSMLQEPVTDPGRYPGLTKKGRQRGETKENRHLANPRFNVICWIRISLDGSFRSTLPETSKFQSLGFIYVFCNYKEWLKVPTEISNSEPGFVDKIQISGVQKEAFGAGHVKKGKFINLSFVQE